jgi:alkanesulfonate monooxygenase SsuD/methylene tetrahydromethanopterin reductase-like flavin-dependent oxidoreductase (luciferase family)
LVNLSAVDRRSERYRLTLPQPLTLAAALAAVTERVRVGTAIVIA